MFVKFNDDKSFKFVLNEKKIWKLTSPSFESEILVATVLFAWDQNPVETLVGFNGEGSVTFNTSAQTIGKVTTGGNFYFPINMGETCPSVKI